MMKLQENKNQFFVAIPKLIVKKKWSMGQELRANFNQDGNIVLMEV